MLYFVNTINGDNMKKYIILIIVMLLFIIFYNNKQKTVFTFEEINNNDNSYYIYCLDVNDINITTKNLLTYFDNNIIGIKASLNTIYESKFNDLYYEFDNNSYSDNLIKYENIIKNKLFNNGYKIDSYKINVEGVKIKEVYLYSNLSKIKEFKNKYKNINYKLVNYNSTNFNQLYR